MNRGDRSSSGFGAVMFDLDGTLLDSLADIGDSVNRMLAEFGFDGHTMDDYRRFVGDGLRMLVQRALPPAGRSDEMLARCFARAREIYGENWNNKTRPYAGIVDLLDRLAARNIPLAILSNKPHEFTVRCVQAYFDRWTFASVMGQSDDFPIKPDPAAALHTARQLGLSSEAFLFVGDSNVDMQTALAAGMHAVGVSWGFRGERELMEHGCQTLVHHPREILRLLE